MSQQIQITGGAKVRDLQDVIIGSSGVLSSLGFNVANGVPQLDSNGKILVSQLPNSVMEYKGTWNAATNTPTLTDGTGNQGDVYLCNVAGTANFGSGPITFIVGDSVIYSGSVWQRAGGATGSVSSVAASITGNAIGLTGSPITTAGTLAFAFAGTAAQYINGAGNLVTFPSVITEAQRLITEVYNETGATLTKGTVVYINGGHGNLPTVTKAIATGDATSAQTYGVVQNDITDNNNGYVVVIGSLGDLDTQAYPNGTQLYLSSTTAGAWTSVKQYAPAHLVYVGIVVRSHPTQGVVEIRIQNGFELDELHNVSAQTPSNNQGLFYNSSNQLWENKSIATALGYTPANDALVVHLTGNETIGGTKTFSDAPKMDGSLFLKIGATSSTTGYMNLGGRLNGIRFTSDGGTSNDFNLPSLTGYSFTFPNASGTVALTSDISYPVTSVFGRTGAVVATEGDYSLTQLSDVTITSPSSGQVLRYNGSSWENSTESYVGTVTSVSALTIGTSGTDLSSTVANSTTTPVITLNVPTASATNRGALSSTDWTTFNNKQNALTNPVTGTGTTNYLPKFTGTSTIGNSLVYDNGTNVGIGTNSPNALLEVTSRIVASNGGGASRVALNIESNGIGTSYSAINSYNYGTAAGRPLAINESGGNVMINTTTDAGYKLDVNGTGRIGNSSGATMLTVGTSGAALFGTPTAIQMDNSYGNVNNPLGLKFYFYKNGTETYGFGLNSSGTIEYHSSGAHAFYTASSGVGALRLTIASTGAATFSATSAVGLTVNGGNSSDGTVGKFSRGGAEKNFYISCTNNQYVNLGTEGDFRFKTGVTVDQPYATGVDAMVIKSNGNILIGTITDRSFKLVVEGTDNNNLMGSYNTTSGASLRMQSNQTVNYIVSATNQLQFEVGAAIRMAITTGGNVLIGTTTDAGGKLTIGGSGDATLFMNGATGAGGVIKYLYNSVQQWYVGTNAAGGGEQSYNIYGYTANDINFVTNSALRLKIASNGTTTLSGTFVQSPSSGSGGFYIDRGTSSGSPYISWLNGSGTRLGYMGYSNTNVGLYLENSANFVVTGGSLNVYDGSSHGLSISNSSGAITFTNNWGKTTFTVGSAQDVEFNDDGGVKRLILKTGGNALIGTTDDTSSTRLVSYSTTAAKQIKAAGTSPAITFSNTITSPTIGGSLGVATAANAFLTGTAAGDMIMINQFTGNKVYITAFSGGVYLSSGATSWTANSDIRLKNINSYIENAVEKLSTLQTINFSYKDDKTNKQNLGLIAQEVEKIFPELIDKNGDGMLGVRYTELVPVLIKAVQELKLEIETLKNK